MRKITKTPKIMLTVPLCLVAVFITITFFNNSLNSVGKNIEFIASRQPERVSELYFSDYAAIPQKLKANYSYQVGFTVANREYRHRAYTYKAIMIEDGTAKVIASKKLYLYNNQLSEQKIQFMPTKPGAEIKVIVMLLNRGQEIRFKATT